MSQRSALIKINKTTKQAYPILELSVEHYQSSILYHLPMISQTLCIV